MTSAIGKDEFHAAWAAIFGAEAPDRRVARWSARLRRAFRKRAFATHPDRAHALGRSEAELAADFRRTHEAFALLQAMCDGEHELGVAPSVARARPSAAPKHASAAPARASTTAASAGEPTHARVSAVPPPDRFHRGPLPSRKLRLAEYLYYTGRISWRVLIAAITWQRRQRPPIGRIAVRWGMLSEAQVTALLQARLRARATHMPFAAFAVQQGMLTQGQRYALLGRQRMLQRRIGEYFTEHGLCTAEELDAVVAKLGRAQGAG